ncbi:MAG: phytoene desaturase family protein [Gammaproteobacteria bacterium]|nr:phytoene desaturase family protein [Gammaproteobacteria bacterium]MDD9894559.1 phytoene desaturase family protein [Gammaproteobacteria bacterium]MDD9957369.1 phytoene desaturase family protein [Gammaproteobacteria bacterium]
MSQALVVGGGFGGIASAIRLRAKGYEVQILDRCNRLGGRAQVFEQDGFKFDAGPTVITAPFLFDELFTLHGRRRQDYVEFRPLDPWYRFQFSDGDKFDYGGEMEDTEAEISRFNTDDVNGYRRLVAHSEKIFNVGFTELSDRPFHNIITMVAQIPALLRLKCYRTVWQMVCAYLQDPKLRQAFSIQPLLVGGNPFDTTSIYGLIHFLERRWGIHFAMGGTGALVDAYRRLMEELGIVIRLNTTVEEILVEGNRACGVLLEGGEKISGDLIISNVDPKHLYSNMLDHSKQSWIVRRKTQQHALSMGLFVLFFGTDKEYPEIAHHTIWLGKRYRELLDEIFHGSTLPKDFSLYLHRPTATDSSFAPEGCDSFYVLAPVPNLRADIDWDTQGPILRKRIIETLSQQMLPGLEQHLVTDFYMTPEDFANDYLSVGGAGFSVTPLFTQSAWFRYHNKAEGPDNLYLVGAGTHPGAGLPGVVSSAKVIDRLIPEAAISPVAAPA